MPHQPVLCHNCWLEFETNELLEEHIADECSLTEKVRVRVEALAKEINAEAAPELVEEFVHTLVA